MVQSVGLGIQVPDFGRSLAQGFQLRAMGEQMEGQNALRAMLAQPGVTQGLLAGDPNILAQIAGIGPQGLQVAAPIMASTQQRQDTLAARAEDRDFRERTFRLKEEAARRAAANASRETFGQPVPMRNTQTGQIEIVQVGSNGTIRPFQGYAPAEAPRAPVVLAPGAALVDPATGTPIAQNAPKPEETWRAPTPEEREAYGIPDGPHQISTRGQVRQIGGGGVTVNNNTGDSALDRAIGAEAAKVLTEQRGQATTGLRTIQSAQRMQALVSDAITGVGANPRLLVARIGSALGHTNAAKQVEATQTLMAEMARATLAQADQLSGVLTDRDMELINRASGGDISLDAGSIRRLIELGELAGRAAIQSYNATLEGLTLPANAAAVFRPITMPGARAASAQPPGGGPGAPADPLGILR